MTWESLSGLLSLPPFALEAPWVFGLWAAVSLTGLLWGALLGLQGWENRRFVVANARRPLPEFEPPHVAVVVPVKGLDLELEESLEALLNQDYPSYEVHFVGESREDPAYQVVARLMARSNACRSIHWHSAGLAVDCAQKVHNLETVLNHLSDDVALVAFADSDAHPSSAWLRCLTFRLAVYKGRKVQGATTGYRVCIPTRASLANWLLYTINTSVGALPVRSGPFNVIWGGAWITRSELLPEIRRRWRRTVNDDVIASHAVKDQGWRVGFEPRIMVPTPSEMNMAQLMEFLRRQFFMIRHYSPSLWLASALVWTTMVLTFWGNVALAAAGWSAGGAWWLPAAVAATAYSLGLVRVTLRQSACNAGFDQLPPQLRAAQAFERLAHPLASLVGWAGILAAGCGRHICWRGIHYWLGPRGSLRRLQHPSDATSTPDASRNRAA